MKKIVYIAIAFVFALTSCISDEKDLFNDSAANRMSAALQEYKDVLTNTPNGWLMEYYAGFETDPTGKMGGYIFLMSFDEDLTVTIASEVFGIQPPKTKKESTFNLIADQGPILTFDTYNEIFHIFSEPSQSDLDGYGGDYEFVIMSANPNEVILKGRRNENRIVMTPLPVNTTWDEYIDNTATLKRKINFPMFDVIINDSPSDYQVTLDPFRNYLEVAGGAFSRGNNCTYSPIGINLYKPIKVGEYNIESLIWEEAKGQFTTTVDGATIILKGFYPEGYSFYDDYIGSYSIQYQNALNLTVSKRCTIVELDKSAGTFLIKGLSAKDWVANYNILTGGLSISSQDLLTPQTQEEYFLFNIMGEGAGMYISDQYKYEGSLDEEGFIVFKSNPSDPSFLGFGVLFIHTFEDGSQGLAFQSENDIYQNLVMRKR